MDYDKQRGITKQMNHSKKHYVKYAAINYAKYMAAIDAGEDECAAKYLANYNDYLEMLQQVNDKG